MAVTPAISLEVEMLESRLVKADINDWKAPQQRDHWASLAVS